MSLRAQTAGRRKIREKVDERAPRHSFLQTRYGVGYKLDPVPKTPL